MLQVVPYLRGAECLCAHVAAGVPEATDAKLQKLPAVLFGLVIQLQLRPAAWVLVTLIAGSLSSIRSQQFDSALLGLPQSCSEVCILPLLTRTTSRSLRRKPGTARSSSRREPCGRTKANSHVAHTDGSRAAGDQACGSHMSCSLNSRV